MAKTAVIFKSNYGATKQYALHIAQETGADLYDFSRIKEFDFEKYDTLIFGGGLYAGKLNGLKHIAKSTDKLAGKNLVVYSVGLGDPSVASNAQVILKSINKALPKELMSRTHIYSFRGSLDWNNMKFMHKTMMNMLNKMLSKKKEEKLTADDREMLSNFGKTVDYTNMDTALPLIEYVKSLS